MSECGSEKNIQLKSSTDAREVDNDHHLQGILREDEWQATHKAKRNLEKSMWKRLLQVTAFDMSLMQDGQQCYKKQLVIYL